MVADAPMSSPMDLLLPLSLPTANCERTIFRPIQMVCGVDSVERPREVWEDAWLGPAMHSRWLSCPGPNLHPPTLASHWRAHPIVPIEEPSTHACQVRIPAVFPCAGKQQLPALNKDRLLSEGLSTARLRTSPPGILSFQQKDHRKFSADQQRLQLSELPFDKTADEEFKEIMKNARRKLEVPMSAAIVSCRTRREEQGNLYRCG